MCGAQQRLRGLGTRGKWCAQRTRTGVRRGGEREEERKRVERGVGDGGRRGDGGCVSGQVNKNVLLPW